MGMAASQARFLQLTARKTNLEYMGQQINQERLSLANQSAGLFEKQLTLEPPTPPSSLDDKYYTPAYAFVDPDDGIKKKVSWQMPTAALLDTVYAGTWVNLVSGTSGPIDSMFTEVELLDCIDNEGSISSGFEGGAEYIGIKIDPNLEWIIGNEVFGLDVDPQDDTVEMVLRYVTIEYESFMPDGSYVTKTRQAPAVLEFDNNNRLINLIPLDTAEISGDFSNADGVSYMNLSTAKLVTLGSEEFTGATMGVDEGLVYSPIFDESAFNDDMNKYEYEKATYDYQIERINLETSQIQKQDKSLELKMKQIDTEHKAISTEIDAVQKVIQKSVESSFKTFS